MTLYRPNEDCDSGEHDEDDIDFGGVALDEEDCLDDFNDDDNKEVSFMTLIMHSYYSWVWVQNLKMYVEWYAC